MSNRVNQPPDPFKHLETSQRPPSSTNLLKAEQWIIFTLLVADEFEFDADFNLKTKQSHSRLSVNELVRAVQKNLKQFQPDAKISETTIKNARLHLVELGVIKEIHDKKSNIKNPPTVSYLNYGNPYVKSQIQHERQEEFEKRIIPKLKHGVYLKYLTELNFYQTLLRLIVNSNDRHYWQEHSMDIPYHFNGITEEAKQEILSNIEDLIQDKKDEVKKLLDKYNNKKIRLTQ
ncbi:MAG: hypothetical protein WAN47_05810 [Nitrosotalea sp.]